MTQRIRNKINSITLQSGVIVDFEDNGKIHLRNKYDHDGNTVKISSTDLEQIRWQAKRNSEIEAGNGVEVVNKEKA